MYVPLAKSMPNPYSRACKRNMCVNTGWAQLLKPLFKICITSFYFPANKLHNAAKIYFKKFRTIYGILFYTCTLNL